LASILFTIISFKYFNQALIILILYIPFQVALNITSGIDLASGRVLILFLFLVWIIKSLAERRFIVRFSLQTIFILAFLFVAIFSITQAWDGERAIRKVLVFLSVFPLYFIITSIKNKNNYISKIINALVVSGFILSLIGIIQFALQFFIGIDPIIIFWSKYVSPVFYGNTFGAEVISNPSWLVNISGATILRAFSLFPDPHMFSFYLGLLIPVVLAITLISNSGVHTLVCKKGNLNEMNSYRLKPELQISKWSESNCFFNDKFLYLILITMLLAELLTFSRGGYLGMIAGISITIILLWKYINFNKKIILGLISAIAIIFLLTTSQSILNRFLSSFNFNEGSNTERLKNWNQGYEMFANNFLFGVGIGNYSIEINPTIEYRSPVYAHNLYLDIGAEMGIFALAIWLLLIGVTIWQLYKTGKKSEDVFSRALSIGLIGSLAWFSAHSFFDTPIYSPTILAIFVIIISLSVLILSRKR
jgi:O-antigen ligase